MGVERLVKVFVFFLAIFSLAFADIVDNENTGGEGEQGTHPCTNYGGGMYL